MKQKIKLIHYYFTPAIRRSATLVGLALFGGLYFLSGDYALSALFGCVGVLAVGFLLPIPMFLRDHAVITQLNAMEITPLLIARVLISAGHGNMLPGAVCLTEDSAIFVANDKKNKPVTVKKSEIERVELSATWQSLKFFVDKTKSVMINSKDSYKLYQVLDQMGWICEEENEENDA